jgi:nicotinamide riboside kinase
MKYLVEFWPKEPIEENTKKVYAIESERQKKGEAFGDSEMYYLQAEPKVIMIVDTDSVKITKWCKAYNAVMDWKVSPLIKRSDFDKL